MILMYIVGASIGFIGNRKLAFKLKGRFAWFLKHLFMSKNEKRIQDLFQLTRQI